MLSVRELESFFLLDGWSDVGAYRGVDPSWLKVSSCHLGPDTICLHPPEGWHFFLIQLRSEEEYLGVGGKVPIPGGGSPTVSIGAVQSLSAASQAAISVAQLPQALMSLPF